MLGGSTARCRHRQLARRGLRADHGAGLGLLAIIDFTTASSVTRSRGDRSGGIQISPGVLLILTRRTPLEDRANQLSNLSVAMGAPCRLRRHR